MAGAKSEEGQDAARQKFPEGGGQFSWNRDSRGHTGERRSETSGRRAVWGRGFRAVALAAACLGTSGVWGETLDWMCIPDGSLNADDQESQSCAFSEISQGKPCQSCQVSMQEAEEFSGLLVPREQFKCMESTFVLEDPKGVGQKLLCPGYYKVKGCDTKRPVFDQRVQSIRDILDDAREDLDTCFDDKGYKIFEARCNQGFPKIVKVELAARIEYDSHLVKDRNPATYARRTIYSCDGLIELLSQALVGCTVDSALGLVTPVSSEVWCQSISWRPSGDSYHPANAQLPKSATQSSAATSAPARRTRTGP